MNTSEILESVKYRGLNVVGFLADRTACGNYRMLSPFEILNRRGANCQAMTVLDPVALNKADIVIAQRQYHPDMIGLLKQVKAAGKKVYYEVDDNFDRVMPTSPVYGVYHPGHNARVSTKKSLQLDNSQSALANIKRTLEVCDGATVSTPDLAEYYSRYQPNIRVVPNAIDFSIRDWTTNPDNKPEDTIVIGYTFGSTHWEDAQILEKPMRAVLDKYPNVKFGLYCDPVMARGLMEEWCLDPSQVHFVAPRSFEDYPEGIGHFDIGLAPLKQTAFNAAKSNLKFLEQAAKKIPVVASVSAPYSTTILPGETGQLCSTASDWTDALFELVENESKRKAMGQAAYDFVYKNFNLDTIADQWPAAWNYLAQAKITAPVKPVFQNLGRNDVCPCGCGQKYKKCRASYGAWG